MQGNSKAYEVIKQLIDYLEEKIQEYRQEISDHKLKSSINDNYQDKTIEELQSIKKEVLEEFEQLI